MNVIPIQFLRVVLGLLGMFFAYALGRSAVRLRRAGQPMTKALTWVLRTTVALVAVLWTRGLDVLGIVLVFLAALALGAGVYIETRPRKVEEIHLLGDR